MAMQVAEWQQRRIPALAVDRHLRASPYSRSHGAAHPEPGLCAGGEPRASHDANDSHEFLQALGDSVITGPTLTNVNDFRVVLINE
jgi:glycerate-2-kinase